MKKKSKSTIPGLSQRYAAFLTALAYRFAEFATTPQTGKPVQPQTSSNVSPLESILEDTFSIPEMVELAWETLRRLEAASDAEWQKGVAMVLAQSMRMLTRLISPANVQNEIAELPDEECASLYLNSLGVSEDLKTFSSNTRPVIHGFLEKIANRDTTLRRDLSELFEGMFSTEAEKSQSLIMLVLQALGEPWAVIEIKGAMEDVAEKLTSSPEFAGAVEMIEAGESWGPASRDRGFERAWGGVRGKIMGRSKAQNLRLPDVRVWDKEHGDTWGDEISIAQESVFGELCGRIVNDPLRLLEEAYKGKLRNSLARAATNDIIDEIRRLRARKRDLLKKESLETETGTYREDTAEGATKNKKMSAALGYDSANQVISEVACQELLSWLSDDERTVVEMAVVQESKMRDVAALMGRSEAWVYKVKKRALERMKSRYMTMSR